MRELVSLHPAVITATFLFESVEQCDNQNVLPSIYDAVIVCLTATIFIVVFCCVQYKKSTVYLQQINLDDQSEGLTGSRWGGTGLDRKKTSVKLLDGSHHHCPLLIIADKHNAQITLPSTDAEIHVHMHRVPLQCNSCSTRCVWTTNIFNKS